MPGLPTHNSRPSWRKATPIVALNAVFGVMIVIFSFAAGTPIAFEPETGVLANGATVTSVTGQSGSGAVKFGSGGSSGSCALPNYPNTSCTGVPAGTSLTTVSGDINVTASGTIIENKNINGCIYINSGVSNVIVRKSKITCGSGGAVSNDGTNALIEDVEIDCMNHGGATAVSWQSYTARRVHAYHCDNTMWAERDVTIEDSYLHDNINYDPVTDPHTDGIQMPGGATNITIRHNTVFGNYVNADDFGNSAITSAGAQTDTNILIQDNLLAGGGYTLYCPGPGTGINYRIYNNHFSRIYTPKVGGFGATTDCEDETGASTNVIHETGGPAI